MDESDPIRKAQEGNEEALSDILKKHESYLRGVAFKVLKNDDDVDDALQAVRIRVWKKIGAFDPDKGVKLSTWLYRITKRVCIGMLRSPDDGKLHPGDQWAESDDDGSDDGHGFVGIIAAQEMYDDWFDGECNEGLDPAHYHLPESTKHGDRKFHDPAVKLSPTQKAKNKKILRRIKEWDRWRHPSVELSPAEKVWIGGEECRPPRLSAREERIRKCLMEGKTRKEIERKEKMTAEELKTAISRMNKKFTGKV